MRDNGHVDTLFEPLALGSLVLPNRLAVAPMTRVSATADGLPTAQIADYYAQFAQGGFGLVITEGVYTDDAYAQGYLHQPGLANAVQRDAWRPIVERVQSCGARVIAQLMHAGALSQGNPYRTGTVGPSAVQPKGRQMTFYRGAGEYAVPTAMTQHDIDTAVAGFAQAAARAREAGFDGIEIHGANGYLLDQFLSEGINLRDDRYGGGIDGRLRLLVDVVDAVRTAVGADYVVGVRLSQAKVNDFTHRWRGEEEAATIFRTVGGLHVDYVHVTEYEAWQPAFETGPSLAALAKHHGGKPVLANGSLHDPARAMGMVERGEADVVSLGRGALAQADWPRRVRTGVPLASFDPAILSPLADLANADRWREDQRRPG
ncbi:NADH:flavin oxidoreductase [Telluria mixta]|uniref:NADH:flavin oxidoreductase n=1 Tax=Telluria mixta TaxID=34071 RepID=A0ABT2C6S1_9BURK|nr:NADH:flavin oxidoreductase [Telluria mixta]MCS0633113.1 NADH:flavin oxidoreductase [Telluria mixta]WEM96075.1 NADH:flavin oxidoreductase [Telluria mixta]